MKKIILAILLTSITTLLAQDATNTPSVPAGTGSFFQTAQSYFTSFNTNLDWSSKGEVHAGVVSLQGPVNLANDLHVGYEVKGNWFLESSTRSSGISGTWLSQQIGTGYAIKVYDAKLAFYGDGGYNFLEHDHRYFGEIGLRVSKKMTRYTYAGVGFGVQVPDGRQVYSAFAGFTF